MTENLGRCKFLLYSSSALGVSLFLKACGGNPNATQTTAASGNTVKTTAKDFKVAVVLPSIITDKAWNQAGYEGVQTAKNQLGVETAYRSCITLSRGKMVINRPSGMLNRIREKIHESNKPWKSQR